MDDTGIGGSRSSFPTTRRSAIAGLSEDNQMERQRAFEILLSAYWKPVYKYIRLKWKKSNEDAKDLTQEFFLTAMEKDFFQSYDPAKARFRTFLRVCLDGFLSNQQKAAGSIKRGGKHTFLSLDYETAEGELKEREIPSGQTPEEYFEREWIRNVFHLSMEDLRAFLNSREKALYFQLFELYYCDDLKYANLASRFDLSISQVTNYLAYARREFKRILLEKLKLMTANDEEFQMEAQLLLGVERHE